MAGGAGWSETRGRAGTMREESMQLGALGGFEPMTSDMDAASEFYSRLLGWRIQGVGRFSVLKDPR